jgi:N-glycosylase/DNA lyase
LEFSKAEKIEELKNTHEKIKPEIEKRLEEFQTTGKNQNAIKKELFFCLLTPQSNAKICWEVAQKIHKKIHSQTQNTDDFLREIPNLKRVRFHRKKIQYIKEANKKFPKILEILKKDDKIARELLIKEIKGFSYKECTHFLRNIGRAQNMAILDRHILRSLQEFHIIERIPSHLTKNTYLHIEEKMREFSKNTQIPMLHLDFVFWYRRKGEIFK